MEFWGSSILGVPFEHITLLLEQVLVILILRWESENISFSFVSFLLGKIKWQNWMDSLRKYLKHIMETMKADLLRWSNIL